MSTNTVSVDSNSLPDLVLAAKAADGLNGPAITVAVAYKPPEGQGFFLSNERERRGRIFRTICTLPHGQTCAIRARGYCMSTAKLRSACDTPCVYGQIIATEGPQKRAKGFEQWETVAHDLAAQYNLDALSEAHRLLPIGDDYVLLRYPGLTNCVPNIYNNPLADTKTTEGLLNLTNRLEITCNNLLNAIIPRDWLTPSFILGILMGGSKHTRIPLEEHLGHRALFGYDVMNLLPDLFGQLRNHLTSDVLRDIEFPSVRYATQWPVHLWQVPAGAVICIRGQHGVVNHDRSVTMSVRESAVPYGARQFLARNNPITVNAAFDEQTLVLCTDSEACQKIAEAGGFSVDNYRIWHGQE